MNHILNSVSGTPSLPAEVPQMTLSNFMRKEPGNKLTIFLIVFSILVLTLPGNLHAQCTGTVSYVATSSSISNALANGGTFTVTYTRGNDQTVDPTLYGSSWPASLTVSYTLSDVIPTDAVADLGLAFTDLFYEDDDISAGLSRIRVKMKIDGPINLVKNIGYNKAAFTVDNLDAEVGSIYDPSVTGTIPGPLTTPAYTPSTSITAGSPNGNFVTTSEYSITAGSLPGLSGSFSYDNSLSWKLFNSGSGIANNAIEQVTAFAKNPTFNRTSTLNSVFGGANTTTTAQQVFGLASGNGTTYSDFGITNDIAFDNIVLCYSAPPVSISGTVFNDVNGLIGTPANTVDGDEYTDGGLVATLVGPNNEVIESVSISTVDGTYAFSPVAGNGTYRVILYPAVSAPANGATVAPGASGVLPSGWAPTGENIGTAAGNDGEVNASLTILLGTGPVPDANFGINEIPTAVTAILPGLNEPVGSVDISDGFSGTDPNPAAVIENLTILTFPDHVVSLTVGTNTYYPDAAALAAVTTCPTTTCAVFPAAGLVVNTNDDGSPATGSEIGIDPANGINDIDIEFTVTDNAGLTSEIGTVSINVSALPVTLISFTAEKSETGVQLLWTTTEETNSGHFEIQHSNDATKWTVAGKVAAWGESKAAKNYAFTHSVPVSGINYYRLKMIDKDATFAYSRIASVRFEGDIKINVYPNPVSSVLKIKNDNGQVIKSVEIMDITGKSVYFNDSKTSLSDLSLKGINLQHVPNGAYVVRTIGMNDVVSTSKIIVVH